MLMQRIPELPLPPALLRLRRVPVGLHGPGVGQMNECMRERADARTLEVVFTRDLAETRILTAYWQDVAP